MDAASGDKAIRLLQEGKVAEADAVLTGFGFQHRIAAALWNRSRYPTVTNPGQDKAAGVNGVGDRAIAFDGVLPPGLHYELKVALPCATPQNQPPPACVAVLPHQRAHRSRVLSCGDRSTGARGT